MHHLHPIPRLAQLFFKFLAGVFAELSDVDVGYAGFEPDGLWNAGACNGIANDVVADRLGVAFTRDRHLDLGAARAFEQLRDFRRVQPVGLLFVDLNDGVARPESYELVGPLAEGALATLNLDLVLVGVDGISVGEGFTTHHEVEAHTNHALIDRARRVVVVADSSKLGQVAFARICGLDDVDELITDSDAAPAEVEAVRVAGLEVTLV